MGNSGMDASMLWSSQTIPPVPMVVESGTGLATFGQVTGLRRRSVSAEPARSVTAKKGL